MRSTHDSLPRRSIVREPRSTEGRILFDFLDFLAARWRWNGSNTRVSSGYGPVFFSRLHPLSRLRWQRQAGQKKKKLLVGHLFYQNRSTCYAVLPFRITGQGDNVTPRPGTSSEQQGNEPNCPACGLGLLSAHPCCSCM